MADGAEEEEADAKATSSSIATLTTTSTEVATTTTTLAAGMDEEPIEEGTSEPTSETTRIVIAAVETQAVDERSPAFASSRLYRPF